MKSAITKALAAAIFAAASIGACAQSKSDAQKIEWPSMVCAGNPFSCQPLTAEGYMFNAAQSKQLVIIDHGSQGIDQRMFDYVRELNGAGFAALVVDHWTPRGVDTTHNDYEAAASKGANDSNIAFDALTAATWASRNGFERIGSMGESQGGQAQIVVNQRWATAFVERNMTRLTGTPYKVRAVDAIVSMYGFCGFRNLNRDAYTGAPFMFITGAEDDETPSKYCEALVPYMNERGAKAQITVLPDEGHSFDAPFRRQRNNFGPHYANCDIRVESGRVTNVNTGETIQGQDSAPLFAKCKSKIYHSGSWKNKNVAVPLWLNFFKQNLNQSS